MAWKTTSHTFSGAGDRTFSLSGDSDWFALETSVAAVITASLDNSTFKVIRDRAYTDKSGLAAASSPQVFPSYPYIKVTVGGAGTVVISERVRDPS